MKLSQIGTFGQHWLNRVASIITPRNLVMASGAALLSACAVVPKTETVALPTATPTPEPSATSMPGDTTRHRIALLVPMAGNASEVGQALANATTMALLDTNANNLRITTYDTSAGAQSAARQAVVDGNELILGPLLSENVPAVKSAASAAGISAIAFTNDSTAAGDGVFVMGHIPEQSIRRSVGYARANGSNNFAALLPDGDYGERSFSALQNALGEFGGTLVGFENYARGNTSIVGAAQRLRQNGGYDTVLIADSARLAVQASGQIRSEGAEGTRILGTNLWSGEAGLTRTSAANGALFAAVSDARFRRFSDSYEARFGAKPYRIATLGYDAVLLTLRIARNWQVGDAFPTSQLYDRGGFLGVDGAFRFDRDAIAQRALEVREVRDGEVVSVDPAPTAFEE
ncbi:MAG: penicillin-binding protein activator [Erythrobacter sp.]|nr:penicillin-binding protein activator [Erythrobacter sp.]